MFIWAGGLCLGHQDLIVHRGAVKLPDGEFVGLPVADRAQRLLELAGLRPASANCDDILTDFLACNLRQFPASARIAVKALLRLRASWLMNMVLRRKMNNDPLAEWGIIQGGHVLGVSSPCQYLASLAQHVTADVSGEVRADALLLAGARPLRAPD